MRRFFSVVIATAALAAVSAGPASADQVLKGDQGPPLLSGNKNALVIHCNAELAGGDRGVIVINKNKVDVNNCE